MAEPLGPRRSGRNQEQVRSYADQQAYDRWQEEDEQRVARMLREVAPTAEPSDSDESDLTSEDCKSSDDESKVTTRH